MRVRSVGSCAAVLAAFAVSLAAPPVAAAAPAAVCSAGRCSVTFAFRGAPEQFTVPAGVAVVTATVAAGSGGGVDAVGSYGGTGGVVTAQIPVTPGSQLTVVVGGRGGDASTNSATLPGGYGGGGDGQPSILVPTGTPFAGGGSGGGGSFVFLGPTVLVAAGGGGGVGEGHRTSAGGAGGAGGNGSSGAGDSYAPGGAGATTSGPGPGGTGPARGPSTFGTGGASVRSYGEPGAGGGGFYGGAAGGLYGLDNVPSEVGGGGGGSGFLGAGVRATARGSNTGDGRIVLSYTLPATRTTLTISPRRVQPGAFLQLSAVVTSPGRTVSGLVTFFRGGRPIGTANLSAGIATLRTPAGAATGSVSFTAGFPGNQQFGPSSSTPTTATVASASLTPAPTATPSQTLANTGTGHGADLVLGGLALIGLGAAANRFGRRRTG